MRKLYLIPALIFLVVACYLWARMASVPTVPDENERFALAEQLKGVKSADDLPSAWLERAHKIGVDPQEGRQSLEARGVKLTNPKDIEIWREALSKPFRAREEATERAEVYGPWRLPICLAAVVLALLMVTIAFSPPKSAQAPRTEEQTQPSPQPDEPGEEVKA